jgi:hypothetical protein
VSNTPIHTDYLRHSIIAKERHLGRQIPTKGRKKNKEIKTLAHFPGKPSMCPAPKQLDNIKHLKKKHTHTHTHNAGSVPFQPHIIKQTKNFRKEKTYLLLVSLNCRFFMADPFFLFFTSVSCQLFLISW